MIRNEASGRTESGGREPEGGVQPGSDAPEAAEPGGEPGAGVDLVEELLIDGQEEVFSRTEVESGRFEHHVGEERVVRKES